MRVIRLVGYWVDDSCEDSQQLDIILPHPAAIIAACGTRTPDKRVIDYLRGACEMDIQMGYSWCRLRCGIDDSAMGDCTQTDGVWIWPQGLAHYVEAHGLPLPEEFVATMSANSWMPPQEFPEGFLAEENAKVDGLFWLEWGRSHSTR